MLDTAATFVAYMWVYSAHLMLVTLLVGGSYWLWRIERLIATKIPTRLDPKNRLAEMRAGNVVSVGLRAKSELGD